MRIKNPCEYPNPYTYVETDDQSVVSVSWKWLNVQLNSLLSKSFLQYRFQNSPDFTVWCLDASKCSGWLIRIMRNCLPFHSFISIVTLKCSPSRTFRRSSVSFAVIYSCLIISQKLFFQTVASTIYKSCHEYYKKQAVGQIKNEQTWFSQKK